MKVDAQGLHSSLRPSAPKADPKLREAAKQFEGILLRQMLTEMQKTTHMGESSAAGGQLYATMVTEALADSVLKAGGLGLTDSLVRSMDRHSGHDASSQAAGKKDPQGSSGGAVQRYGHVPQGDGHPVSPANEDRAPTHEPAGGGPATMTGSAREKSVAASAPNLLPVESMSRVVSSERTATLPALSNEARANQPGRIR